MEAPPPQACAGASITDFSRFAVRDVDAPLPWVDVKNVGTNFCRLLLRLIRRSLELAYIHLFQRLEFFDLYIHVELSRDKALCPHREESAVESLEVREISLGNCIGLSECLLLRQRLAHSD